MRDQAQTVIIGGGIAGLSIAYHLALEGMTDVVLLEKGLLTSGSTCHAAGLVTGFHTSLSIMEMRLYSVGLYADFMKEAGDASGWHPTGSLRVASGKTQLNALKQAVSKAKGIGLDLELLSPEEAGRMWPALSLDDVEGAIYLPDDGWLDPHGMTSLLAQKARAMGVTIETGTLVTDIELSPQRAVTGVVTDRGRIQCENVVCACGMWAPRIAEMVGIVMPMVPVMHQHLTTLPMNDHPFPKDTPVLRDRANLIYVREEVRGLLIGGFELDPMPWSVDGVPWEHTQQALAPEWDQFESILEGAVRRIPVLENAQVGDLINHPDAMTPDGYPCVGPSPDVHGFWGAAGLSLNGFGMSGGLGRVFAEWMVHGEPSIDMTPFDIRRFGEHYRDRAFVTERGRETYKYYYFHKFPHDEWEWGRPLRESPLHERVQVHGAVFGEKDGYERVNHYEPGQPARRAGADQRDRWQWGRPGFRDVVGEEHRAARERVALFDLSSFGKIDVSGKDALPFLQRIAANDVNRAPGRLIYTQFLNERGGIQSDVTIARLDDDRFRIVTGTASLSVDMGWLRLHQEGDDVVIEDVTRRYAALSLWGPNARDVLAQVSDDDVSNAALPYFSSRTIHVAGRPVLANRVSYVGELGWELYPAADDAVAVWDALLGAGVAFELRPAGYKAIESLRLEKGYLAWGSDITAKDDPISAGLGFAVRLAKGAFIGRDAVKDIKQHGPESRLCTLISDPDACVLYGGEALFANGEPVGRIRTTGFGYTVNKNIALAYLPVAIAAPGQEVQIESFGERVVAQVAKGPLYDPNGDRLRG